MTCHRRPLSLPALLGQHAAAVAAPGGGVRVAEKTPPPPLAQALPSAFPSLPNRRRGRGGCSDLGLLRYLFFSRAPPPPRPRDLPVLKNKRPNARFWQVGVGLFTLPFFPSRVVSAAAFNMEAPLSLEPEQNKSLTACLGRSETPGPKT